jgi:hypothetical protein
MHEAHHTGQIALLGKRLPEQNVDVRRAAAF